MQRIRPFFYRMRIRLSIFYIFFYWSSLDIRVSPVISISPDSSLVCETECPFLSLYEPTLLAFSVSDTAKIRSATAGIMFFFWRLRFDLIFNFTVRLFEPNNLWLVNGRHCTDSCFLHFTVGVVYFLVYFDSGSMQGCGFGSAFILKFKTDKMQENCCR